MILFMTIIAFLLMLLPQVNRAAAYSSAMGLRPLAKVRRVTHQGGMYRPSLRLWTSSFYSSISPDDENEPDTSPVNKSNDGANHPSNKWRTIAYDKIEIPQFEYTDDDFGIKQKVDLRPITSPYKPSPVELVQVRGRNVYIKRDDLLRLEGSNVSGNKARKMFALNQIPADDDFPKCIVSYGGVQSNAMVAIAAVVQSKISTTEIKSNSNKPPDGASEQENGMGIIEPPRKDNTTTMMRDKSFTYYTKKVPRFLRKNPSGNYFRGTALGMEIMELSNDEYRDLFGGTTGGKTDPPLGLEPPVPGDSVWIPQGGASGFAVPGCRLLANEIVLFWAANGEGRPLTVFVPGGTCSTAVMLHREIRRMTTSSTSSEEVIATMDIQVVVIPCVGDDGYAERQMMSLNMETGGSGDKDEIPKVLKPAPDASFYLEEEDQQRYFRFGEPNAEILDTFREMEDYGVATDLLYGAPSWNILLRHWGDGEASSLLADREIMYVHSGGLEGVNSQMMRYRHKGLVEGKDVQHPERQRRSSKAFQGSGKK